MTDPTEAIRRERLAEINTGPGSREALEAQHGQVWDTQQLAQDFEVIGFLAPLVVVRRMADGVRGTASGRRRPSGREGVTREASHRVPQERNRCVSPGVRSCSHVALRGGREAKGQAAVKGVGW